MTALLTILIVLVAEAAAVLAYRWWQRAPNVTAVANDDPQRIDAVVRSVFMDVGLNADAYADDFDLLRAGKLTDVLHHAARRLGCDPELTTVGDVKKWLAV